MMENGKTRGKAPPSHPPTWGHGSQVSWVSQATCRTQASPLHELPKPMGHSPG